MRNFDRALSVFSPEGHLFQVEYCFKAAKGCGLTGLAIRGKDCVVSVCQKKVPDASIDADHVTSFSKITPRIGGMFLGIPADCRALRDESREKATEFEYENGYPIPVHYLSQLVADSRQKYTQKAFMRLMAVNSIFMGIDEETNLPQLFKVDPAGLMLGYKATATGTKEEEGVNTLEKLLRNDEVKLHEQSLDTVARHALASLQSVLGVTLDPSKVEVMVASAEQPEIRNLTTDEIAAHLDEIARTF